MSPRAVRLTLAWVLSRYPAPSYGLNPDAMEQARANLESELVRLARSESESPS